MATDVPFWRASTGAEQRIKSLVRFLEKANFDVKTFYLGQTGSVQFTEGDRKRILELNFDVEQRSSEQRPKGKFARVIWFAKAIFHRFVFKPPSRATGDKASQSTTLADYRWPWAVVAFKEAIASFQPDIVLIQYVKLAYLLDAMEASPPLTKIIDTHDVLHRRCERFREQGFEHWIEIDRAEETSALQQFDLILAIQPEEAKLFSDMAPNAEVVVCGHAVEFEELPGESQSSRQFDESDRLVVGYLGSINHSNCSAIESMIEVIQKNPPCQYRLVIAGAICRWVSEKFPSLPDGIELLGRVDALPDFYQQVDVVVNPVSFGTGLKIKNVEAVGFGKPVVTTPHGMIGVATEIEPAFRVEQDAEGIHRCLTGLQANRSDLLSLSTIASRLQTSVSREHVYGDLVAAIRKRI